MASYSLLQHMHLQQHMQRVMLVECGSCLAERCGGLRQSASSKHITSKNQSAPH
jgi:hypothetical protein